MSKVIKKLHWKTLSKYCTLTLWYREGTCDTRLDHKVTFLHTMNIYLNLFNALMLNEIIT